MDAGRTGEAMETRAHIPTRRHRTLASLAVLVALIACAALSAAAFARTTRGAGHHSSCSSARHAKRGAAKHCAKHHGQKTRGAHKTKKPAAKTPPAPKLTAATCEDGSAPVHSAGTSYTCEDGSEPGCEDGSNPVRPSASS